MLACCLYLLLTGQALTLHGVLIVDRKLPKELPASLQRSVCPCDRTLTLRYELHVLHGLRGTRGILLPVTFTENYYFYSTFISYQLCWDVKLRREPIKHLIHWQIHWFIRLQIHHDGAVWSLSDQFYTCQPAPPTRGKHYCSLHLQMETCWCQHLQAILQHAVMW